jgi:alpha-D-xyloside xylohydrolase
MFVHTTLQLRSTSEILRPHNVIYSATRISTCLVFLANQKTFFPSTPPYRPQSGATALVIWFLDESHHLQLGRKVRNVAAQLRAHKVSDRRNSLDTGWFETDWRSDYKFSSSRFKIQPRCCRPEQQGFHVSVWQYTYFTSKNEVWKEMVSKGYQVKNEGGELPFEDATPRRH